MRKLIWLAVILAIVWTGWWFAASKGVEYAITRWFQTQQARGQDAGFDAVKSRGYPLWVRTVIENPHIRNTARGIGLEATAVQLEVAPWWPGDVSLVLPDTPIAFVTGYFRNTLTAQGAQARVRVAPGTDLAFDSFTASSGDWDFRLAGAPLVAGKDLWLSLRRDTAADARYALRLRVDDLRPGAFVRSMLRLPQTWPDTLTPVIVDADIAFDRPWDRRIANGPLPRPTTLDIQNVEIAWDDLRIDLQGALNFDASGVPSGVVTLRIENWRGMLSMAQTAGLLDGDAVKRLEGKLAPLAAADGEPAALDTELRFADGMVTAGGWVLGPAPRLTLR